MTTKTKVLGAAAAVAAVTIVGAYAFAQGGPGMDHGRMGGMGHGMMGRGIMDEGHAGMKGHGSGAMMGNAGDPTERLEAIRTEIGIRPDQTTAWDTYAKVVAEVSGERRSHRASVDRDAVHKMEPKDRQAFRESMQGQRDESIAKVRSAAETLVSQLDDAQKEKARRTLPGLIADGPGGGMRHGMMVGHGQGPGMGPGMGRGMGPHNSR